jgi:endonuclease/exonuclease/phosphatase family metal-dependent hydrolase
LRYFLLFILPLLLWTKPFKIATYNVENLFDASYQGSEYEEYIPGKHNWNARMVQIKLNHTAEVICDLNADILGLQEIENKHIFKQLITKLNKVGCGYKYAAITKKKGASIQVALLSRYPIKKQKDIQVSFSPRVRNILEVEVDVGGHNLTLFVNHWKSKAYKGYESKRIKYAKVLQSRIARLAPSKEYIILGDFNSDYNAYLTLDDKINDTQGRTAFNDVLKTKVDGYLVEENEMMTAQNGVHFSLWKELPIEDRWSHKFYGKKSSLYQIVLPRQMFDGKGLDYVNNSFKVYKAEYLFTKRGYINRWRYKNGKHMAKGYSDHLPVYAYFDSKPYVKENKKTVSKVIEKKNIAYLYEVESLERPIELHDVVVVLKRGRNAVVKQSSSGRGVFFYGCASKLEEGRKYDLLVEGIKTYKGLKEVTHAYKLKDKGLVNHEAFIWDYDTLEKDKFVQNEVLKEIMGVYKNRYLYTNDKKIPIYFKKKKLTPKNGTQLKIHYAHLGYYKKEQLVIYSQKDFEILEK